MEGDKNWANLQADLLIAIVERLSCLQDFIGLTAVCKSWNLSTKDYKPLLPPKYPLLLLAEDVVPGSIISDGEFDSDGSYSDVSIHYFYYEDDDDDDEDDVDDNSQTDDSVHSNNGGGGGGDGDGDGDNNYDGVWPYDRYDHRNNSIGSNRGLYSLSSGRTYKIELPEAAGRLILGANYGWLLTLGRDLQIHLLHPLLRYQIPLPPMLTFPAQYRNGTPQERFDMFIHKVAMSSKVATKDAVNLLHDTRILTPPPIVMVCYGGCGFHSLAYCRFGDKEWTGVEIQSRPTDDIVYHKGRFYTVNNGGEVFVCDIQNGCERPRATKIASLPFETFQDRKYLVESVSGSTLFLLVHCCKYKIFYPLPRRSKYRTTNFLVWKMEIQDCDDCLEIPSCTLTKENNIGNQAIFVGRNTSVSISPSETVRPNCIYFTDDRTDCYHRVGGGHDMGIFSMEDRTIEPHFSGKSIHFISPPLWYI
nr:PREDICTED: uncharacterized protein LOC108201559 [Daucus carota subsp. sativus]